MSLNNILQQPDHKIILKSDGSAYIEGENKAVEWNHLAFVKDNKIANVFYETLNSELADLVDIAMAVYTVDRLVKRIDTKKNRYHLSWSRKLQVTVPLRNPNLWKNSKTYNQLIKILSFFTDDNWSFNFTMYKGVGRISETQQFLFAKTIPEPTKAVLFSGGLDSFAGLYRDYINNPEWNYLLISINTNNRIQQLQKKLIDIIKTQLNISLTPISIPLGLNWRGKSHIEEQTQRSRGFLFMTIGAVAAIMAKLDNVTVYENGIGALSLPYTNSQLGAHNTRSAHPISLYEMGNLITLITKQSFRFHNPLLFTTKGEACRSLNSLKNKELINLTVSCDRFPQRIKNKYQCGYCTSCILRRQALYVAGLHSIEQNNSSYCEDILNNPNNLDDEKLYQLRAMLHQVAVIKKALESSVPWYALCKAYPQLFEVEKLLSKNERETGTLNLQLLELYNKYCEEWNEFPARPPKRPLN